MEERKNFNWVVVVFTLFVVTVGIFTLVLWNLPEPPVVTESPVVTTAVVSLTPTVTRTVVVTESPVTETVVPPTVTSPSRTPTQTPAPKPVTVDREEFCEKILNFNFRWLVECEGLDKKGLELFLVRMSEFIGRIRIDLLRWLR